MKILFLTITDWNFFTGTLAGINSLLDHLPGSESDIQYEIIVVENDEFGAPLSEAQRTCLETAPHVSLYPSHDFEREGRILGAWQLKAYAAHDLTSQDDYFDVLVGFDSDLFFVSDVSPVAKYAFDTQTMLGGKDGDTLTYGPEYSHYGIAPGDTTDKYMSASCYFCPLNSATKAILKDWAEYSNKAVYGPQSEKIFAGHGDQGVLNAVIHAHTRHENVETLPNRLWSQHWVFEDDVLEWDLQSKQLLNYSMIPEKHLYPPMRTIHCGGSDKFWTKGHSDRRKREGAGQRWAYALWLKFLLLGKIAPWSRDPMLVIPPASAHVFQDLIFYAQLIGCTDDGFYEAWDNLPWQILDRATKNADQHRMMTLCGNGSMDRYIELLKKIPDRSTVVEVGSYLGGSVVTGAMATLHKKHRFVSVESFTGNRDGTVDGWELPMVQQYIDNVRGKWPFLNIDCYQLPSEHACRNFDPKSIEFVFIDGNHSEESVSHDLGLWAPKVKTGGFIAGDDWGWEGVRKAVTQFCINHDLPYAQTKSDVWCVTK